MENIFSSLLMHPHEAISLNGRLYFNMGNLSGGLPVEERLLRRRGRAKHYAVEVDKMRVLMDEGDHEVWHIHNADEVKAEVWRDIIRCDSLDDARDPRRFELANYPGEVELDITRLKIIAGSYLRSILVNGWLVPKMSDAKMVGDAAIVFPTFSPTDPDEPTSKQLTVIRGVNWDGRMYRLGKFVWATNEDAARKSYEALSTSGVPFAGWWGGRMSERPLQ